MIVLGTLVVASGWLAVTVGNLMIADYWLAAITGVATALGFVRLGIVLVQNGAIR